MVATTNPETKAPAKKHAKHDDFDGVLSLEITSVPAIKIG